MDVKKQTKLVEFLTATPNSDRKTIEKGTKIKGALLTNLLKRLEENGLLSVTGEGADKKYSIKTKSVTETKTEPVNSQEKPEVADSKKKPETKTTSGRDNQKYKFENQEYGKGPLVRAVVAAFVKKSPKTTLSILKKVFPDGLLHRYGVFQELKEAKKLSGTRDRYFMKPEQVIKLKDATIAVCNQWTSDNIQPFLVEAKRHFTIK